MLLWNCTLIITYCIYFTTYIFIIAFYYMLAILLPGHCCPLLQCCTPCVTLVRLLFVQINLEPSSAEAQQRPAKFRNTLSTGFSKSRQFGD